MPTVGELNEKHGALLAKVRELRDAHKDKEMPAEKAAEVDRLLDEADEVKAGLEAVVAEDDGIVMAVVTLAGRPCMLV